MAGIGIVLSGGGVRGFAHLGFLQVLDECGIRASAISGVSAGAIAGALYAAGHSPHQILLQMKASSYFGWSNFLPNGNGLFSMTPLQKELKQLIPQDNFSGLSIPLFVTATDFTHHRSVVFSADSLSQAVVASCAVPFVFEPVRIGDSLYVDGGLLDNFPVAPLLTRCDTLIGCHVNKVPAGADPQIRIHKASMLDQAIHLAISPRVYANAARCAVFVEPDLSAFTLFDTKKADQIFQLGYQTTLTFKDQLLRLAEHNPTHM